MDADSLTTGSYSSTLSFTTSTQTRFDLVVSVQIIGEEIDSGDTIGALYVEFTDVETGESAGRVMATFDRELDAYRYISPRLDAAGKYTVMVGLDVDNDGAICEVDDLCGALTDDEGLVPVVAGELDKDAEGIDMEVRIVLSPPGEADSAVPGRALHPVAR